MNPLNGIIDWLQATFPPNRIVVLLGGILTAVSSTAAAWLAAHFPGLALNAPEIAGVLAAAALITIRLLDRWIDQWQKGEGIDFAGDTQALFDELLADDDVRKVLTEKFPELFAPVAPVSSIPAPPPPGPADPPVPPEHRPVS